MIQDIIDGIGGAISSIAEAITTGILDFFTFIGSGLLDLIFTVLGFLVSIIIFPIDSLFRTLLPGFSDMFTNFNNSLSLLASAPISYFAYHIPPITRSIILVYITLLIGYYSIIWTYRAICIIPNIIQRLKFW